VSAIRIDAATAHKLVAEGAKIIDVRTPEEFAAGAKPGAVNIPVQVIGQQIADAASPTDTIVLYCKMGGRADVAANILRSMGYSKSFNVGGLYDW